MKTLAYLVLCSMFLGVVSAADKVDESKMDEKEKTRRRMLRAAGIDPDKKKEEPKPAAAAAPMGTSAAKGGESYAFNVTGMMCNNCETSVSLTMKKIAGVSDAKADTAAGTAVIKFDPAMTTIEIILEEFKKTKAQRFEAFKAGDKPSYTYSGKDETLRGRLAIKPADAGADVVCRINAHRSGENADRWFNVVASGDLATQIEKIRKEGVQNVRITGVVSDAGVKATKIEAE
jgi:copper chaperone CopZ